MTQPRIVLADRGDAGQRLDLVLRRHLADLSSATRTRVQGWIRAGQVSVNGVAIRRVSARAANGDIVHVHLPAGVVPGEMAAEDTPLDVLYEDEYLLAVAKPAGIVVHPTHAHAAGTLMNALRWRARAWPWPERPSIVGRLDKLTSGVVLVARTAPLHAALQRALAGPDCDKSYLAVVYGRVDVARGAIDLRLARDTTDRRRVVASAVTGAPSLTRFERLAVAPAPGAGLGLLRCRLVTGRTHQIRVHLAARGWPIVGDPVYGEPKWAEVEEPELRRALESFPRQALHAWRLGFMHPVTGARLLLEAPIPEDLRVLLSCAGLAGAWG
jgi:23S rRNA pseudouridine1911/1915/1917 synthase